MTMDPEDIRRATAGHAARYPVTRPTGAGGIKIYITDEDGLICGEPNCPTDGVFDFPHPRGRTLAELTIMIVTHTNEHHAPAGFVNHIRPVAQ